MSIMLDCTASEVDDSAVEGSGAETKGRVGGGIVAELRLAIELWPQVSDCGVGDIDGWDLVVG